MFALQAAMTLGLGDRLNPASLVEDTSITVQDVLLGRGASADRFQGNTRFRALVRSHKDTYQQAPQHRDKAAIAQQIVDEVYAYGGRFLRRVESERLAHPHHSSGGVLDRIVWEIVKNDVAVEKVKQAMRDIQQAETKGKRKSAPSPARTKNEQNGKGISGSAPEPVGTSKKVPPTRKQESEPQTRQGDPANSGPLEHDEQAFKSSTTTTLMEGPKNLERPPSNLAVAAAASVSSSASPGTTNATMSQHLLHLLESNSARFLAASQVVDQVNPHLPPANVASLVSTHLLPTRALSDAVRDEVAYSWKEIPGAYLDFMPEVREGRVRPFCSEDLQILLLTMAWAEAARDVHCLGLIRTAMAAVLDLPQPKLNLRREEVDCLIGAMRAI